MGNIVDVDHASGSEDPDSADASEGQAKLEGLREEKQAITTQIGELKSQGEDASELIARARKLTEQIDQLEPDEDAEGEEHESDDPAGWETKILTETSGFEELREDWQALLERSNPCSPFMRWEWLFPWWKYFGDNRKLRIVTVRDTRGKLVAVAPLMLGFFERRRFGRKFFPRTLAFVGSAEQGPRGYGFGPITRQDAENPGLNKIWQAIERMQGEWDTFRLREVDDGHATWRMLAEWASNAGNGAFIEPAGTAACGPLPDSYAEFLDSMPSARKRRYLKTQYAKLTKAFASVELGVCASPGEVSRAVRATMDLNVRRHENRGVESGWSIPKRRKCLTEAALSLAESGNLRVATLTIDRAVVAGVIALVQHDTMYAYVLGFRPNLAKHHVMEPLYAHLFRTAIEDGLSRFDWLSDRPYQRHYVSEQRQRFNLEICSGAASSCERSMRRRWLHSARKRLSSFLRLP